MGYETQLLIGTDTKQNYNGRTYFMLAATIDLCKVGNSAIWNLPWKNETPDTQRWEWYAPSGDGDTPIAKDCYDDIPRPIPLLDVLNALNADIDSTDYRRLKWARQLLQSMHDTSPGEFSVLLWSH